MQAAAPIQVDPSEVSPVDPRDVTIDPNPAAERQLDVSPGVPLYQFAPGGVSNKAEDLPPMSWGEAIFMNPVKQAAAAGLGAAAGANRVTGGIAHLLDTAATKISGMTGLEKGETCLNKSKSGPNSSRVGQEQQSRAVSKPGGNAGDLPSQLIRTGVGAVASLPTYAVASELGGPIAGMAGLGALETADQGAGNMTKAALQNALTGGAITVMGPAGRLLRLIGTGSMTYAQLRLEGVPHETALANAMTMSGMAGMPAGGKTAREIIQDTVAPGGSLRPSMRFKSTLLPPQQQAVDYLHEEGVPLTGFQQTGNRFLGGVEATTAHTPLGSQRAREFQAGTQQAMGALSEKLASQVHPQPVTPYEAGKAAGSILDQHIAGTGRPGSE